MSLRQRRIPRPARAAPPRPPRPGAAELAGIGAAERGFEGEMEIGTAARGTALTRLFGAGVLRLPVPGEKSRSGTVTGGECPGAALTLPGGSWLLPSASRRGGVSCLLPVSERDLVCLQ